MADFLKISAAFLAMLGVLFLILSRSSQYLMIIDASIWSITVQNNTGLLRGCDKSTKEVCSYIKNFADELATVRVLLTIAMPFQVILIIVGIVITLKKKGYNAFILIFQLLAVIAVIISLAVYTAYYPFPQQLRLNNLCREWKLGWSYALGWAKKRKRKTVEEEDEDGDTEMTDTDTDMLMSK
eukprot:gene15377-16957_t